MGTVLRAMASCLIFFSRLFFLGVDIIRWICFLILLGHQRESKRYHLHCGVSEFGWIFFGFLTFVALCFI